MNGDGFSEFVWIYSEPSGECVFRSAVLAYESPAGDAWYFQYNGDYRNSLISRCDVIDIIRNPGQEIVLTKNRGDTLLLEIVGCDSELFKHKKGAFTGAHEDRKGLVEEAEVGTLFLDEISNVKLTLQAKLLHLLQEREFRRVGGNSARKCNVRLIAATNRSLPEMCDEGRFRSDLYYRLKVVEIALPPLRHQKDDIPLLAQHFMEVKSRQCLGRERKLHPEAINALLDCDWPGNISELENTIERLVILSPNDEVMADELMSILGNMWLEKVTTLKSLNEMAR